MDGLLLKRLAAPCHACRPDLASHDLAFSLLCCEYNGKRRHFYRSVDVGTCFFLKEPATTSDVVMWAGKLATCECARFIGADEGWLAEDNRHPLFTRAAEGKQGVSLLRLCDTASFLDAVEELDDSMTPVRVWRHRLPFLSGF